MQEIERFSFCEADIWDPSACSIPQRLTRGQGSKLKPSSQKSGVKNNPRNQCFLVFVRLTSGTHDREAQTARPGKLKQVRDREKKDHQGR